MGILYIVGTPIGNLSDITLRALETLKIVDWIACEDTRVSYRLLKTYNIKKRLIAYHKNNEHLISKKLLGLLLDGKSICLISDSGMPVISDPGYLLINLCIQSNVKISVIPGCSSITASFSIANLSSERFAFLGFFDDKNFLMAKDWPIPILFFESPYRIIKTLNFIASYEEERNCVIVRELTKKFEEVIRGNVKSILDTLKSRKNKIKGELVLLLDVNKKDNIKYNQEESNDLITKRIFQNVKTKDIISELREKNKLCKREIYKIVVQQKEKLK